MLNNNRVSINENGDIFYTADVLRTLFREKFPNGTILVTKPEATSYDQGSPTCEYVCEARVFNDENKLIANGFASRGSDTNISGFAWCQTAAIVCALANAGFVQPILSEVEKAEIIKEKNKDLEAAAEKAVEEVLPDNTAVNDKADVVEAKPEQSKDAKLEPEPEQVIAPESNMETKPETKGITEEANPEPEAETTVKTTAESNDDIVEQASGQENESDEAEQDNESAPKALKEDEYPSADVVRKMISDNCEEGEAILEKALSAESSEEALKLYKEAAQKDANNLVTMTSPKAIRHKSTKEELAFRSKVLKAKDNIDGAKNLKFKGISLVTGQGTSETPAMESPRKSSLSKELIEKYSKSIPMPDDDKVSDEEKIEAYKSYIVKIGTMPTDSGKTLDELFIMLANKEPAGKRIATFYLKGDSSKDSSRAIVGEMIKWLMDKKYRGVSGIV